MRIQFDPDCVEDDPEYRRVLSNFAKAKMEFISYMNEKLDLRFKISDDSEIESPEQSH